MRKLFLLGLIISSCLAEAQSWQDTVVIIDKIFSRYADANPGAQLAISRNGQLIYSSARGMADLERNVPLTKQSRIEAGSVSKQFTAACILLLEQQGKLSLNDDIRKYVPEIPVYGQTITIKHLLHHTSGLKDWGSIAEITGWPRGTKAYSNDDALYFITLQKTLNNKPGDEFIYSNSNYNLMAVIIQRVSGLSLAEFSKKNIFEPAGMKNTEWRDDYRRVVSNRAIAYSKAGNGFITNMPNENAYGNGGLLTTAEDLLTWTHYYLSGKLGSPSLLLRQLETMPLNSGKPNVYAAGLVVDKRNGLKNISHSGATAAYRSNLEHFPDLGLSIAWLSNNSQQDLSDIPSSVGNVFVRPVNNPAPSTQTSSSIDLKTFLPYLGAYRDNRTGAGVKLFMKDGGIYSTANGGPLPPINATTLAAGRGKIVFSMTQPRWLNFISANGDTTLYTGVDSAKTDEKSLNEYTGTYFSDETETKVMIYQKEGKLFVKRSGGAEAVISPSYKDGFNFPGGDIYFVRDKAGKLSHFFISIPRARNVKFMKMKN